VRNLLLNERFSIHPNMIY